MWRSSQRFYTYARAKRPYSSSATAHKHICICRTKIISTFAAAAAAAAANDHGANTSLHARVYRPKWKCTFIRYANVCFYRRRRHQWQRQDIRSAIACVNSVNFSAGTNSRLEWKTDMRPINDCVFCTYSSRIRIAASVCHIVYDIIYEYQVYRWIFVALLCTISFAIANIKFSFTMLASENGFHCIKARCTRTEQEQCLE